MKDSERFGFKIYKSLEKTLWHFLTIGKNGTKTPKNLFIDIY